MKKLLLTAILTLLLTASAFAEIYIRPDGFWSTKGGELHPWLTVGMSEFDIVKTIGKYDNNSSFDGYLDYGEVRFWTFNVFENGNRLNITSTMTTLTKIRCIESMDRTIKTMAGVGIGNTCQEVWAAHGTDCQTYSTYNSILGYGFYYETKNYRLFFSCGNQSPSGEIRVVKIFCVLLK